MNILFYFVYFRNQQAKTTETLQQSENKSLPEVTVVVVLPYSAAEFHQSCSPSLFLPHPPPTPPPKKGEKT